MFVREPIFDWREVPVADRFDASVPIDAQALARQQLVDALEERSAARDVAEGKIQRHTVGIEFGAHLGPGQDRFDFGGEAGAGSRPTGAVIDRFFSQLVSGDKKRLPAPIPQRKTEGAIKRLQTVGAVCEIGRQRGADIPMHRSGAGPEGLLLEQFRGVGNGAIEGNRHVTGPGEHRGCIPWIGKRIQMHVAERGAGGLIGADAGCIRAAMR